MLVRGPSSQTPPEPPASPSQTTGELVPEFRGNGEPVLLIHGALIEDMFLPLLGEPALSELPPDPLPPPRLRGAEGRSVNLGAAPDTAEAHEVVPSGGGAQGSSVAVSSAAELPVVRRGRGSLQSTPAGRTRC